VPFLNFKVSGGGQGCYSFFTLLISRSTTNGCVSCGWCVDGAKGKSWSWNLLFLGRWSVAGRDLSRFECFRLCHLFCRTAFATLWLHGRPYFGCRFENIWRFVTHGVFAVGHRANKPPEDRHSSKIQIGAAIVDPDCFVDRFDRFKVFELFGLLIAV